MPKQSPGVVAELRPPSAVRSTPAPGPAPAAAFMLTVPQLETLMREAARQGAAEALAERSAIGASARPGNPRNRRDKPGAALVGVLEMADHLGISRSKLNGLRLEGCPAVKLGAVYRFEPGAVLTWLRARGGAP